jgi:hypothetical protein
MSYWDRVRPQPVARPPAHGPWYQPQPVQQPRQYQRPQLPQRPAEYAPATAQSITETDRCPRCGSANYASVIPDASMGGPSGKVARCFDCRYPGIDASGDIIRGGLISASNVQSTTTHKVRAVGNPRIGSWGGSATWDSAPLVV